MRTVARKLQPLVFANRYSFSGFGKSYSSQLDPTTPISTRIISSQETIPPINNSTIHSKTRTRMYSPQFAT